MKPTLILMLFLGFVMSLNAQDNLRLKGKTFEHEKANIALYSLDELTGEWTIIDSLTNKSKYCFDLDTDTNYKIEFTRVKYKTQKTLYIHKGKPGKYKEFVDVDFKASRKLYAHIYQIEDSKYCFPQVVKYRSLNP